MRADFVLAFAECVGVVASAASAGRSAEGGTAAAAAAAAESSNDSTSSNNSNSNSATLQDVRSLYERSLAAMSAATSAYHAHLAQASV
jgi:hypothetical protein